MPSWLTTLAWIFLATGFVSSLIIAWDLIRHKQHMWIMDVVWPITGLYSGVIGLVAYFKFGRLSAEERVKAAQRDQTEPPGKQKSFSAMTAIAATHCGAGCTLGDICAEWIMFLAPLTLFGHKLFGSWAVDFIFAFCIGIAFQYFTIKPMKHLSRKDGIKEAIKADTLSLTCWQIGMYGWMAIATFLLFGHEIPKNTSVFWFMMQIAMGFGFLTSYPVNSWLLRKGIKEKM